MNEIVKKRLIIYLLVFLIIINLTALFSFLFYKWSFERKFHRHPSECSPKHQCMADFCRNELKLDKNQVEQYNRLKKEHHQEVRIYMDSLKNLDMEIFNELSLSKPDTQKLHFLADQFGKINQTLKYKAINHLMTVKANMNAEQQQKFFKYIMESNSCGMFMGPQHREKNCPRHQDSN
jgi:hypothetical protein